MNDANVLRTPTLIRPRSAIGDRECTGHCQPTANGGSAGVHRPLKRARATPARSQFRQPRVRPESAAKRDYLRAGGSHPTGATPARLARLSGWTTQSRIGLRTPTPALCIVTDGGVRAHPTERPHSPNGERLAAAVRVCGFIVRPPRSPRSRRREAVGISGSSGSFKTLQGWHEISSRLTVVSCC